MKTKSRLLKIFAVVFVALFALACLVGFVACGDECEHENVTWSQTVDATCGEDGSRTGTCDDCGEEVTEVLPATGNHSWDDGAVTTEPTFEAEGEMTYTCTICGATKIEAIDKLAYMTDADVAALSAALKNTIEHEGSYTLSTDIYLDAYEEGYGETAEVGLKISCDVTGIEYLYMSVTDSEFRRYDDDSVEDLGAYATVRELYFPGEASEEREWLYKAYEIEDGVKSMGVSSVCYEPIYVYRYYLLYPFSPYLTVDDLIGISTVSELEDAILGYLVQVGSDEVTELKMTVSGGKYTISAVYDRSEDEECELFFSVTVKDGMVTKINAEFSLSYKGETVGIMKCDSDISYSYDPSLAFNFSDLSQFEPVE